MLGPSRHLAPFLQGVLAHSSTSYWHRCPLKPVANRGGGHMAVLSVAPWGPAQAQQPVPSWADPRLPTAPLRAPGPPIRAKPVWPEWPVWRVGCLLGLTEGLFSQTHSGCYGYGCLGCERGLPTLQRLGQLICISGGQRPGPAPRQTRRPPSPSGCLPALPLSSLQQGQEAAGRRLPPSPFSPGRRNCTPLQEGAPHTPAHPASGATPTAPPGLASGDT